MADNIVLAKYKADVKDALRSIDQLDKKVEKLDKDTKRSSKDMQSSFTSAFSKIGAAAGIAFGTQQLVQFGKEAVTVAAQFEGVERAFKRIGGANSANLLQGLRNATRGTVSDLQLMQKAVQASNFKIPLENLASLFKFAQARARETGESVSFLTDSIVLGIGRKSPLILDNLGISAVELRERLKGVGVEAANVGDIAEIIGDIAEEELAKMGDQADTTADKIAQISTAFENMKVEAGKAINSAISQLEKLAEKQGLIESQTPYRTQIRLTTEYANAVSQAADQIEDDRERELRIADQVNDKDAFVTQKKQERIELLKRLEQELATVTSTETRKAENLKLWFAEQALENAVGFNIFQRNAAKERISEAKNDIKQNVLKEGVLREQIDALREILGLTNEIGGDGSGVNREQIKNLAYYNKLITDLQDKQKDANTTRERVRQLEDEINEAIRQRSILLGRLSAKEFPNLAEALKVDVEEMPYIAEYTEEVERQTDIADKIWERHFNELMQKQDEAFENEKRIEQERQMLQQQGIESAVSIVGSLFAIQQNSLIAQEQELQKQLEQGLITREKYDQELKEINQKQAQSNKDAAIFQATISTAQAVVNALGSFPFSPANIALAATIGAAGAAQIAAIASQPLPQFAEGGWVTQHGKIVGRSHAQGGVKLEAEGGEFIIKKIQSKKHPKLIESINAGKVEEYIAKKYIIPTVQQIDGSMSGLAASARLNGFNDMNLLRAFDRNRQAEKENAKYVVKGVVNGLKQGRSRWN